VECPASTQSDVVAVAAGRGHSVALKSNGTVVAWGNNSMGQCNTNGLTNVVAIDAHDNNTMALKADGTVVVYGDNTYGQCNVPAGLNLFAGGGSKPGVVNPDISGEWALDSVKDGVAVDASGNSNHGVITGASLTTGIISNALEFDGVDDKVTFSYSKPENNFTLEAWVKPTEPHQIDTQSNSGTAGTAGQKYIFGANQEGANGVSEYLLAPMVFPCTSMVTDICRPWLCITALLVLIGFMWWWSWRIRLLKSM
jgi:hypothetical protein